MCGKSQRNILSFAAEEIRQHAKSLRAPGNVVENQAGRGVTVQNEFSSHADLFFPRGAGNHPDFAQSFCLLDPFPQVSVGKTGTSARGRSAGGDSYARVFSARSYSTYRI